GILMLGRDRCVRDLSSVHGSYRSVDETDRAIELIGATLDELGVGSVFVDSRQTDLKQWPARAATKKCRGRARMELVSRCCLQSRCRNRRRERSRDFIRRPGHGRIHHDSVANMRAQLERCIEWMKMR